MSAQPVPAQPDPDDVMAVEVPAADLTGDAAFDAYTTALDAGGAPVLGHLVLYSIFDGKVTRDRLEGWFRQLGLDLAYVPPPIRAVDAFEKVTGPDGVHTTYPLTDPARQAARPSRRRAPGREATLMLRHVRRDKKNIVRHVVREIRDEEQTSLSYDSKLGEAIFVYDQATGSSAGAGTLQVAPDHAAIAALPETEQQVIRGLLDDITTTYQQRRTFLTGDKLRGMIRRYVEDLGGIKVRPTGGVYFCHRKHAETLAQLRKLVAQFGEGSHLVRIPIPDQDEMREVIIAAFTTQARDELNQLAKEIAAARRDGADENTIGKLWRRFRDVQQATADHSDLLSTSLDDTTAALDLVKTQLGDLLATAGDTDD